MAPQKNTFAAIREARATPVNAQEWVRTWIFDNYFHEYCQSTRISRPVVLSRAVFDQLYVEPALERRALEPAPAPEHEATSDSSESGGVPLPAIGLGVQCEWRQQDWAMTVSGFGASFVSSAPDGSTSNGESNVSSGMRSPRQHRSLLELLPEQPELDEVGSGYEADSSDNEETPPLSSITESDSSSTQYTPDASSSDSDNAGFSDSDSEAQHNSSRVTAVAWREHHERLDAFRASRLAELDRAIGHARHFLRNTVAHSYGEYMTSVASLEALEREREQLRSGVIYPRHQLFVGIALPGANTHACSSTCKGLRSRW